MSYANDPSNVAAPAGFMWGGIRWGAGDLSKFQAWLRAHGDNYGTWAANHPGAAGIFGKTAVAAGSTPQRPAAGGGAPAAGGGAGDGGSGSAGNTPTDLQSLIENDPIYAGLKGNLSAQDIADAASRKAAIDRALIDFGMVPDLNGLTGLSPQDLAMLQGDITPDVAGLAKQNSDQGLSLSARLAQAHADNLSQLQNALAARGMLSSGTTGFETGREDLRSKQATSDAISQLLDAIHGYINSYTQGANARAGTLSQGATDAAARVAAYLGDSTPGGAATGGSSASPAPATPAPPLRTAVAATPPVKPLKTATPATLRRLPA